MAFSKSTLVHVEPVQAIPLAEDTPAYECLQTHKLLNTDHRKNSFDEIFGPNDLSPNSSKAGTIKKKFGWGVYWTPGCGLLLYHSMNTDVTIPAGHICCFIDNDNEYLLAKPGIHSICDPFMKRVGKPMLLQQGSIIHHGTRTVVIVPQGKLGYATDMGQPVLLPPGLHSWMSETLRFEGIYDLESHVITIGPYTLLTVDEGYAAITQNNGMQDVLSGGKTHLLTHQKWRFEKFITLKIQTDDLEKIRAASADNVIMLVNSTVVWKIQNVRVAATMAAETMATSNSKEVSANITKLRRDVLKQAIASLAGFIGSVNYSDSFHVAAAAQRNMESAEAIPLDQIDRKKQSHKGTDNPMFNPEGMSEAVVHANLITSKFGVEICSINIISANPVDDQLTASLATGAVASAEALQAETQARGMAKAMKIEAEAKSITAKINAKASADATMIEAQAASDAEILRAEGSKQAAALLESSQVAVSLEKMRMSASALNKSDKFFFGQDPSYMKNILMTGVQADIVDCD